MPRKRRSTQFTRTLETMPVLKHWDREAGDFDIRESEVIGWLWEQDVVLQWLFSKVYATKRIVFDPATGTWSGRKLEGLEIEKEDAPAGTEDSL